MPSVLKRFTAASTADALVEFSVLDTGFPSASSALNLPVLAWSSKQSVPLLAPLSALSGPVPVPLSIAPRLPFFKDEHQGPSQSS